MAMDLALPKTEFLGFYVAEVIDDVDTVDNKSGRVKLRVFPMMTGLDATVLPWATPAFPLFVGAGTDQGSYCVPAKGSRVWVFFAAGDVRSPVYFANAPGMADGPADREPGKTILRSKAGHVIVISDVSGSEVVSVETAAGHKVELDDAGNVVTVEHKDGEKVVLTDSAVQLGKGTLKALINEGFKALYDGHKHGYVNDSGPQLTTVPSQSPLGTPPDPITPDMITTDTKAS